MALQREGAKRDVPRRRRAQTIVVLLSAESRRRRERKRQRSQEEEEEGQGQGTRAGDAEAKQVVVARIEPRSGVQEAEDKAEERKRRQRLQQQRSHSGGPESKVLDSDEELLFPEESQAKYVARRCPGLLAKMGLQRCRKTLRNGMGLSLASREPGPAMVQYFRQTLSRLNPLRPLAREALSLCAVMDQLFEGEVVRALDVSMQRLKYLEAIMRGRRPEVASRMELIPEILNSVATDEELRTAAKEQKQDERLQAWRSSSRPRRSSRPWQGKGGDRANRSYPPKGGAGGAKEKGFKGAPQSEVVKPKPADA